MITLARQQRPYHLLLLRARAMPAETKGPQFQLHQTASRLSRGRGGDGWGAGGVRAEGGDDDSIPFSTGDGSISSRLSTHVEPAGISWQLRWNYVTMKLEACRTVSVKHIWEFPVNTGARPPRGSAGQFLRASAGKTPSLSGDFERIRPGMAGASCEYPACRASLLLKPKKR